MNRRDLAERVEIAFRRCAEFPEIEARDGNYLVRGDAFMAFIELRNLMPDVLLALSAERSDGRR